ncbi:MAG: hypothetical protein ACYDCP_09980 [Thermoplasmataceae archaeon]
MRLTHFSRPLTLGAIVAVFLAGLVGDEPTRPDAFERMIEEMDRAEAIELRLGDGTKVRIVAGDWRRYYPQADQ